MRQLLYHGGTAGKGKGGRRVQMRITIVKAWYDAWVGAYWDDENERLYILPVPFFGICLHFRDWRP
jgi:hypothetical protein